MAQNMNGANYGDEAAGFSKGMIVGLLTGGAIGAALALLFAPKPGRELRTDLASLTNDYVDKAGDLVNNASSKTQQFVNEGRTRAEHLIDDAREKASTILSDAERIVNDAKAKASTATTGVVGNVMQGSSRIAEATKAGTEAFKEELRSTK